MNNNTPAERIAALRAALKAARLDAWIAPSADPHLSEYIPEHWQTRRWLSGFDGSVPTLIITAERAELWADSRYWEQAEQQLQGSGIALQKLGFGKTHIDSLADNLAPNSRVGVAADEAVAVRHARFGGEVVHFVVEQDAGAVGDKAGAVAEVQGVGVSHRVAVFIHHGVVRGLVAFVG